MTVSETNRESDREFKKCKEFFCRYIYIAMRHSSRLLLWGVIPVIIIFFLMWLLINPVVASVAQAKIETLTTKAVNRAIAQVITAGTYRELTDIRYDLQGKITSVSANMLRMNGLSSDIALSSQSYLESFAAQGIAVPLGTFSGIPILTGRGPGIVLRLVPVGSVHCTFESAFIGQGINQTLHRIVLKVQTLINLIMPLGGRHVEAEIEAILCENIIVGEVPEFLFTKSNL
jgi:sporulation protein YunB